MNVLAMGITPWGDRAHLALFQSKRDHEVRTLGISCDVDYRFDAGETASDVVARIAKEWRPDLLFCGCPEVFPPPREIEQCPVRTVAAISDWNLYQPQLEYNLARFDLVLTDRLGERSLRVCGAQPRHVQPLYSQRTLIHRPLGLERDIDILFLGNLNHAIHRERGQVLELAAALSGEYRVHVDGEYPPQEYAHWLNRARIVLNFSVRHEMNLRCFEAPACGALLFVEEANLEVRDWLRDREEVVLYNRGNLTTLLRYYLEHEEERARVAAAGCMRAQSLAMEHRMDDLFDAAGGPPAARPFAALDGETRALAEVLFFGASLEPAQRALARASLPDLLRRFESPAFRLAAGCAAFEDAVLTHGEQRKPLLRECLEFFHAATDMAPGDAVAWHNLAVVARQGAAADLENQLLRRVLDARTAAFGAFVLGKVSDPSYAEWRRRLGLGAANVELLHAAAHVRLAQRALELAKYEEALEHARAATAQFPEHPGGYRMAGAACTALEQVDAAAAILEQGLPHTAFDPEYRLDLVRAWRTVGRKEDARRLAAESARIFSASPRFAHWVYQFRALV